MCFCDIFMIPRPLRFQGIVGGPLYVSISQVVVMETCAGVALCSGCSVDSRLHCERLW